MACLGRADSPAQAAPISYPLTPNSSFLIPNSWEVICMKPLVAIVGRPNVGKSMLFNKLMRPAALHRGGYPRRHPGPASTASASGAAATSTLVDTGGIEPRTDRPDPELSCGEQAEIAIDNATVIVFV